MQSANKYFCFLLFAFACSQRQESDKEIGQQLEAIKLNRGDITLCGTGQFGNVSFASNCAPEAREDFNLATALLHSFEYAEAEKAFVKVIDQDPKCVMAYWGLAMCNFHPLWAPPSQTDLRKGQQIIALGRSVAKDKTSRESIYLEAIAAIYDRWDSLDHHTRVNRFKDACAKIYEQYPDDVDAATFYALALDASADPTDKTFAHQKIAGEILNKLFAERPDHPGIAHYLIHNYDYAGLAEYGLPAARKYASIAANSAHAQHMPSHIFTRLGLWDESIESNLKSVSAARCYAEQSHIKGHWDEEIHGLDYLIYAYLQKGDDANAEKHVKYLQEMVQVTPVNNKGAFSFAAVPARYALERRDWNTASNLALEPIEFPWEKYLWEQSHVNFARLLGAVHTKKINLARTEVKKLNTLHAKLIAQKDAYKAGLVDILRKSGNAWLLFAEGNKPEAIAMMNEAALMEDGTTKPPVTPGEILPARELLADMYLEMGDAETALKEYESALTTHPNRYNSLCGAITAARRIGKEDVAKRYEDLLKMQTSGVNSDRVLKSLGVVE